MPFLLQSIRVATGNRGRDLTLTWDADNCPSSGYHVLYGFGSGVAPSGVCGMSSKDTSGYCAAP